MPNDVEDMKPGNIIFVASELADSISRLGSDLKQRIVDSVRSTWESIHRFAQAHRSGATPEATQEEVERSVAEEVDEVLRPLEQQHDAHHDDDCQLRVCLPHILFVKR